jgi:nucleoside-diphosphate-sugar epimerase
MMHINDAIRGTIELMDADPSKLTVRTSYNLAAISFAPEEIAAEIKKHITDFKMDYAPDYRQQIADSWPKSIDDSAARKDWGWKHKYGLSELVDDMLKNLKGKV